jgi:ABC-type thiamine transport system ATPase subunit
MDIHPLRTRVQDFAAQRRNLLQATSLREGQIQTATEDVATMEEAQALVQRTATETQEQLRFHLEDLVQHALDSLLPGRYTFKVDFDVQRGKTAASMYLEADGQARDPMDECGGTVVQVVAFALRVAAWTLARTDNTIILDEPFAAVSADFRPVCGELLAGLSEKLGIQFIVVASHESGGSSYLLDYADRVFLVSRDSEGRSQITMREGEKHT